MLKLKTKLLNLIMVPVMVLAMVITVDNTKVNASYNVSNDISLIEKNKAVNEGIRNNSNREKTYKELAAEAVAVELEEAKEESMCIEERIKEACDKYGVPFNIVLAIARLETGWFTSPAFVNGNNPGGLCSNGSPISFASVDEGVDRFVSNLANNYFAVGLNTPELIGPKYCPGSQSWIDQVEEMMWYEYSFYL